MGRRKSCNSPVGKKERNLNGGKGNSKPATHAGLEFLFIRAYLRFQKRHN